jgi:ATP-dependent exoDNAse (exonuclease V) alpha subunit
MKRKLDLTITKTKLGAKSKGKAEAKPKANQNKRQTTLRTKLPKLQIDVLFPWILRNWPIFTPASQGQKEFVFQFLCGHSIFFTGPGGTGKSWILKTVIESILQTVQSPEEESNNNNNENQKFSKTFQDVKDHPLFFHPRIFKRGHFAVTASTGVAALNLKAGVATTVHNWMGLGLAKESAEILVRKMKPFCKKRWQEVRVFIWEEVSMSSATLLDKFDQVARLVRGDNRPFGGIQVILVGDLLQLPPVPEKDEKNENQEIKFIFESPLMQNFLIIELTENFRQNINISSSTKSKFIEFLQRLRIGKETEEDIKLIQSRSITQEQADTILQNVKIPSLEMFSIRQKAYQKNLIEMAKTLVSYSRFKTIQDAIKALEQKLDISTQKIGKTNDKNLSLLNQSYWKISYPISMEKTRINFSSNTDSTDAVSVLHEIPFSVFHLVRICHLPSSEESNQGWIPKLRKVVEIWNQTQDKEGALQQTVITFIGLKVRLTVNLDILAGLINGRIGWIVDYSRPSTFPGYVDPKTGLQILRRFPKVWFPAYEGSPEICEIIFPREEKHPGRLKGGVISFASRFQIPLEPAFCSTIHKVQGLTLENIVLHGENLFASGMSYVSFSRARTLEGVYIVNYQRHQKPDPKCLAFVLSLPDKTKSQEQEFRNNNKKEEISNEILECQKTLISQICH